LLPIKFESRIKAEIHSVAMPKSTLFLVFFYLSNSCLAQISGIIPSPVSIAQTSASDSRHWTAFHNPAMLGAIEKSELAVNYENRFQLSELSTKSIQAAFPNKIINTGISLSQFGYSLYQEFMLGVGWGRNFSDKFSMGIQLNYFTSYFEASNSYRAALLPQFGLLLHLASDFNLGFACFNPFHSSIQADYVVQRLPSVFSIGTEYFFIPELVWRFQIDREVSSYYRFSTGFEYSMQESVAVKLGAFKSDYLVPCLGLGVNYGEFGLVFNAELHPLLGLSPRLGLKYSFLD
jgi:hypothetical protein